MYIRIICIEEMSLSNLNRKACYVKSAFKLEDNLHMSYYSLIIIYYIYFGDVDF